MKKITERIALALLGAAALGTVQCTPAAEPGRLASAANELPDLATVAYDPAFVDVALKAIDLSGQTRAHFAQQDAATRKQSQTEAAAIRAEAMAHQGTTQSLTNRWSALTGIPGSELSVVSAMASTLRQKYPTLTNTGPAFIGQAIDLNPLLRAAQQESNPPPPPPTDCIDDCNNDYETAAAAIIASYALDLAFCAILGVPAGAFCVIAATAWVAWASIEAENARQACIDICNGIGPGANCDDDGDCPSNQWCDKGPNQCKPDKANGQTCSRDAKCLSGCCKYDFWQNPVSMTCNPAADCN